MKARIEYYNMGADSDRIRTTMQKPDRYSAAIWLRAAMLAQQTTNIVPANLMNPALNDMIDIVTTCEVIRTARIPDLILSVLMRLCLVGSFVIGYTCKNGKTDGMITTCFAIMTALAIYMILDLDRPRQDLITMDAVHQKMVDLRIMFLEK